VPLARIQPARVAIETGAAGAPTPESLFGEALHRLLEIRAPGAATWPPAQLQRVAREFGLAPAKVRDAAAMAQRILGGEGAWAWDAGKVDWQGNEVALLHEGESLRLDRLVRRAGSGEWWVLDFKSASRPERDAALVEQMRRYRRAVQAANPGAAVKAALLTGSGRIVEIE
jgi:ATP-dependent helicase/nuclease subunit A